MLQNGRKAGKVPSYIDILNLAGNGPRGDNGGGQTIVRGNLLSDNLAGIRSVVKRGRERGGVPSYLDNQKRAGT